MKTILAKYVSFLLSLTALAVMTNAVSAKAETISTRTPMYGTYTDSSKSAVASKLSDLALKPSSNLNPPVDDRREPPTQQVIDRLGDDREAPTQQVIDRLGDDREMPSQEATAPQERVQQRQPKGAGESRIVNPGDRDTYQQEAFRAMPKAETPRPAVEESVATQPAPRTTSLMPKAETPRPAVEESVATQPAASTIIAMPKAQTPALASDEFVNTQPAAGTTIAMPKAQTSIPAVDESASSQSAAGKTSVMPKAQMPVPGNHELATTQPAAGTTKVMPKAQTSVPANHQLATTQPAPGTAMRSATGLIQKPSTSPRSHEQSQNLDSQIAQVDITPGQPTRSGSSYVGVGGNIGITGSATGLSQGSFVLLSKIGLTNTFSVRPSVVFGSDTTFLLPVTYDFSLGNTDPFETFRFAPYFGGGLGYATNGKFGFVLTGGLDIPITREFTATIGVNGFLQKYTDVGLLLGVGYNFVGF